MFVISVLIYILHKSFMQLIFCHWWLESGCPIYNQIIEWFYNEVWFECKQFILVGSGSRGSTPPANRKSPTMNQGVQVSSGNLSHQERDHQQNYSSNKMEGRHQQNFGSSIRPSSFERGRGRGNKGGKSL